MGSSISKKSVIWLIHKISPQLKECLKDSSKAEQVDEFFDWVITVVNNKSDLWIGEFYNQMVSISGTEETHREMLKYVLVEKLGEEQLFQEATMRVEQFDVLEHDPDLLREKCIGIYTEFIRNCIDNYDHVIDVL